MPYKRGNGTYYVDIRLPGYGRVALSTRSTSKTTAQQHEATLRELANDPGIGHAALDALTDGRFTLPELHAARVQGDVRTLVDDGEDPPLAKAVDAFLDTDPDGRYQSAAKEIRDLAPSGARLSWVRDPLNLRAYRDMLKKRGLAAATIRARFAGVGVFMRQHYGEATRAEVIGEVDLPKVPRPEDRRTRWLTTDEIGRLREHAGRWWVLIGGAALGTGMRLGEILNAKVRDIDFGAGTIVVETGKSRNARRMIPLDGEPLALLRGWVAEQDLEPADPLFPEVDKWNLRYAWEGIREAANLEEVRFHDLRHTYAVHNAKAGMPLGELQQRLGHASIDQTMRYAQYAPPIQSTHYRRALAGMGMGDKSTPSPSKGAEIGGRTPPSAEAA